MSVFSMEQLGLTEAQREAAGELTQLGRVAAQYRDGYTVLTATGERSAVVAGRLRHESTRPADFPAVGDFVALEYDAEGAALLWRVLPRHSLLVRQAAGTAGQEQLIAANVDTVFICMALNSDYNLRRLERYLSLVWSSGATPVVVLTKADVCEDVEGKMAEVSFCACGAKVLCVSALAGDGVEALQAYLGAGKTAAFIGSSGVGKSTLINRLLEKGALTTAALRKDGKGRHTTTRREMLLLPGGGIVIDTPGMRELALESGDLSAAFADIEVLAGACRFADCRHDKEPGCAVRQAAAEGLLPEERLKSWRKLRQELLYAELDSRRLEEAKMAVMFADVGGRKNARRMMQEASKRRRF